MIKGKWVRGVIKRNEGLTLIEVLIALAIFGFMGIVALSGLGTSLLANQVNREKITADYLAKSQLEYVKSQTYKSTGSYSTTNGTSDYCIQTGIYDPWTGATPPSENITMQRIEVKIFKGACNTGKLLLTISEYKLK